MSKDQARIVTRGDDSGSCHSANRAILDAFHKGVLRNTSIMVPAPVFEVAAVMYKDVEGLCIGLHATLTDEWNTSRWGPVLGAESVPSLVMEDGTFFKSTRELWNNNPNSNEVFAEIQAQLGIARSHGLNPQYLDAHMAFDQRDNLVRPMQTLAENEGLIYRPAGLNRLPQVDGVFLEPVEEMIARLDATEPGKTYLVVAHPCYDEEEIQQMTYGDKVPGEIARERDWERRIFMDDRIVRYFETHDIAAIAYTEVISRP